MAHINGVLKYFSVPIFTISLASGCQDKHSDPNRPNPIRVTNVEANTTIGDEDSRYQVLGSKTLRDMKSNQEILPAAAVLKQVEPIGLPNLKIINSDSSPADTDQEELTIGFPIAALSQPHVFGGVITGVSDQKNEMLGMLKLSDLTPIHVTPEIARVPAEEGEEGEEEAEESFYLALLGCVAACTEESPQQAIIAIPIIGVDPTESFVLLDLKVLGEGLNLVGLLDPNGSFTGLEESSSRLTLADFSSGTLVFDIASIMVPLLSFEEESPEPIETTFTARWYLRSVGSFQTESFVSREPIQEVGFFTTDRSASTKITRWSLANEGRTDNVKYYLKNIPTEYQQDFARALDDWNASFEMVLGQPIFDYEFINSDHPQVNDYVAGDIRFNILEWDIDNLAPYGGLGPSISNQLTGELFSANVLVQGPRIVEVYKAWFATTESANELRNQQDLVAADILVADFKKSVMARFKSNENRGTLSLKLNGQVDFRIPAQMPQYLDEAVERKLDFDEIPAGETYESYMAGYWRELVAHELGHNIGLRHNFRGNLSASGTMEVGSVSHSVMEYLSRSQRHLNRISEYDLMAIRFGYLGETPARQDLFCTDENVSNLSDMTKSPECSRDDLTNDPFGFFESRLARAQDLLVARGSTATPLWSAAEMSSELKTAVEGMALYHRTALLTSSTWTNWQGSENRPTDPDDIERFVIQSFQKIICDPTITTLIEEKESEEAREKSIKNLVDLRSGIDQIFLTYGISEEGLACRSSEE